MTWQEVCALAGLVVSQAWVLVMIFRAPRVEAGWGGGYAVPLPVLVVELITAIRDERREARKAVS